MILKVSAKWAGGFFLARALPCLLGFALLCQLLLLWLVLSAKTVTLPASMIQWLENGLSTEEWQVSLQGAVWRPPGQLQLNQVAIAHQAFREPIFRIEQVEGIWDADALLWMDGRPSTLRIRGLSVGVPSLLSSSGSKEGLVEDFYLTLARHGRWWHLRQADGYVLTVPLSLQGQIYLRPGLPFSGRRERPLDEPRSVDGKQLASVFRQLADLQNEIRRLQKPLLQIQLDRNASGDFAAQATLVAEGLQELEQVSSGGLRLDAELTIAAPAEWAHARLMLGAEAVHWSDSVEADAVSVVAEGAFSLQEGGVQQWPQVAATFRNVRHDQYGVDSVRLKVDPADWPVVAGRVAIGQQADWLRLEGALEVEAGAGELAFSGGIALADYFPWLTAVVEGADEIVDSIGVLDPPGFEGKLQIGSGWQPQEIDFFIQGKRLSYLDLAVIEYSANAQYRFGEQQLHLSEAHLLSEEYEVEGSFSADFIAHRYRYLLSGSIDPRDLNTVLEEEWWDQLWDEFSFDSGQLPYADMDIGYQRKESRFYNAFFGSVAWQDVHFRSVPYDAVSMRLHVSSEFLTLYDMRLQRNGRQAEAILQWAYDDQGDPIHIDFSGISLLNLHAIAATAGPEVLDIVSGFSPDSVPRLEIAGRILSDADGNVERVERVAFKAQFDHPLGWDGFEFEELTLQGNYQDDVLDLSPAAFRMAGGSGFGSVRYDLRPQIPTVQAQFNLSGANHYQLLHSLPWTRDAGDWEQKAAAAHSKLDIEMEVIGHPNAIDSYTGQGQFVLQDTDLGKIHLFGGLSRALDLNVIHFGSFEVDTAKGGFFIDRGLIHLREVTIEGPTLRLEADGSFTFEDQQLDLGLTVYPVGGLEPPLLRFLSKAFDPLSRAFQVTVTGSWSDPKYRVGFNPFQVFSGERNPAANGVKTINKDAEP